MQKTEDMIILGILVLLQIRFTSQNSYTKRSIRDQKMLKKQQDVSFAPSRRSDSEEMVNLNNNSL